MARWTIRGYANQVRLFLFLVVFFLVMQGALNFSLLFDARDNVARAARQQASQTARQLAAEIPRSEDGATRRINMAAHLARLARTHRLTELALLRPGGVVEASSSNASRGRPDADLALLTESEWRGFATARQAILLEVPWRGPGRLVMFHPLLDPATGRLQGILKVKLRPVELISLTRRIRVFALVQAVGVVAVVLLTFAFIRWMLQPYRLLVRTAGMALPHGTTEEEAVQRPGGLIEAFQGVVDTLQRQEREIVALRNRRPDQESLQGPLVDNLLSGVVVADAGGVVTALNAAGQRILGVSLQDALGVHYRQVVGRSEEMVRLMDGCMQDRKGRSRVLVRMRDGKGGAGHLGASVSPLEPDGMAAVGVLCIFSDLTEIRQVEERVRLRENLAEVGQQSAGIAHEVRNALATILGYARLAARSPAEEAKEHAAAIGVEVESIQTVLADYLQFARPLSLNLERLQLGKLVREVVADLQREAGPGGASVQVSGEFGEVEGDEVLLRQAIGNLVRNGLEAAGPDGRVALEGRTPAPGKEVILEVHDDGPGLPQGADVEDLFRPFYTTKRDGTGLGLSMARKTVVYHDGEITADRGPWGGARFTITLPTRLQEISGFPEAEQGNPGRG